jgi:hypothetical protein
MIVAHPEIRVIKVSIVNSAQRTRPLAKDTLLVPTLETNNNNNK